MPPSNTEPPTFPCPEPDCSGVLTLKYSRRFDRHFYGCSKWASGCNGGIGAHKDGRPLGVPADSFTKKKRIEAHNAFDRIWKSRLLSRTAAYQWLSTQMGREIHMGELGAEDCDAVVLLVRRHFPELFP